MTSQSDDLGRTTTFVYAGDPGSATGGTTTVTDPKGNVTLETYRYGLRVSETKGYGTPAVATTQYRYDPVTAQPILIVDPKGHATTMTYDAHGNMLSSTDALNHTTTSTYNSLNEQLTVTDPKGVTTTNTYDTHGNLTQSSTPCPACSPVVTQTTTYHYGDVSHPGDLTSMVDPVSNTWTYTYDANGDRTSTTDPLGNKTTSSFNADGWLVATVAPKGNVSGCNSAARFTTTNSYVIAATTKTDGFGDVQQVTDPLGNVTKYLYDADRNKLAVTDPDAKTTFYVYDLDNEQIQVVRPGTPSTTLVTDYYPDGTVKDQKDGKGNPIQSFRYSSLGQVTAVTDALGNTTTYAYDPAGNKTTMTNPAHAVTRYAYNAGNELTSITYSDGTTPNVTAISYDPDGQETAQTDGSGTWHWTYDWLHRVSAVTEGNNGTVHYNYDLRKLPTKLTYPSGVAVTLGYDKAGRQTSVKDWLGNTSTFAYDADANLVKSTLANGVVDATTFNGDDLATAINDTKAATTVFSATYSREGDGLVVTDNSAPAGQGSYKYSALNQLCYAGSAHSAACSSPPTGSTPYAFDAADNLTTDNTATQQFNAADELCSSVAGASITSCASPPAGATTFSYDSSGNETSQLPSTNVGTCHGYDQANRLTSVETGTGSACTTPNPLATYTYNGTGLRMTKTMSATTTQFTWDQSGSLPLLLQEKTGAGTPTSYVYGPGGVALEQVDSSGTTHFYAHDQLGSTRALTSSTGSGRGHLHLRPLRQHHRVDQPRLGHEPPAICRAIQRRRVRALLPPSPLLRPDDRTVPDHRSRRGDHDVALRLCGGEPGERDRPDGSRFGDELLRCRRVNISFIRPTVPLLRLRGTRVLRHFQQECRCVDQWRAFCLTQRQPWRQLRRSVTGFVDFSVRSGECSGTRGRPAGFVLS